MGGDCPPPAGRLVAARRGGRPLAAGQVRRDGTNRGDAPRPRGGCGGPPGGRVVPREHAQAMCQGEDMSNQPARAPRPALDLRGAVDLSALARRANPPANGAGAGGLDGAAGDGDGTGAAGAPVIEVTDATFVAEVV